MSLARGASPRSASLEYVSSAAATIFGPSKRGLWAMLSAYFDESGTDRKQPVLTISGLIASPRNWERLTVEWQRILDSEGLAYFHMKEYVWSKGQFKGWSNDRRDALMMRLIPLIKRRVEYRTWTALYMPDYRHMVKRDHREELPYTLAAIGCCSCMRELAIEKGLPQISSVFDRGHEGEIIFRSFEKTAEGYDATFYRMGMLSTGESKKCPPLQAADLHAWEVRKYFADQAVRSTRTRKSFARLLTIPEAGGGGYLFVGEKLRRVLRYHMREKTDGESLDIAKDHLDPNRDRRVHLVPRGDDERA